METKHWNMILGKWVLSGLLVILQKQCRRVYEIIKLKYTTPQTLKGYRLEVKKRLHQPFQVNFAYCLPHRLGLIIDLDLFNTPNWIEKQCQLVDFIFLFIQSFEHCPNSAQEFFCIICFSHNLNIASTYPFVLSARAPKQGSWMVSAWYQTWRTVI